MHPKAKAAGELILAKEEVSYVLVVHFPFTIDYKRFYHASSSVTDEERSNFMASDQSRSSKVCLPIPDYGPVPVRGPQGPCESKENIFDLALTIRINGRAAARG